MKEKMKQQIPLSQRWEEDDGGFELVSEAPQPRQLSEEEKAMVARMRAQFQFKRELTDDEVLAQTRFVQF